ncbi:hypothetical protein HF289_06600 [Acidithiobacillus ferrooxidans]|nr:hypothetical protein [Acidithiobacillus ferrooxidans]MBU2861388.1 hypothetical protein [Acidithiobacillus ferrooxidans]
MCGSGRWYGSRRAIWWGSKEYRFPAKSYGWGWGILTAWQGWTVLVVCWFKGEPPKWRWGRR